MSEILPRGPYLLDIPYLTEGMTHHMKINCDTIGEPIVGQDPDSVMMRSKSGDDITLDEAANELWGVIRPLIQSTTVARVYSLFKTNEENDDLEFISGGDLSAPNGSNAGANKLMWGLILTYRSGGGHVGKIELMETTIASDDRFPLGSSFTGTAAIKTYLLGGTSIVMCRDRSFPVAGLNESSGQNERLFKKRHRF